MRKQKLFASEQKLYSEFEKDYLNEKLGIISFDNKLFTYPKILPDLRGLNVVSLGVQVGEIVRNRFSPFHSLFNAYGNLFNRQIVLDEGSKELNDYLKGEELNSNLGNGYGVFCVNGYSIGGVKISDNRAKNLYPKGLRN